MPNNLDIEGEFKARPFPKEIFTDYAYEQMRESEKYRDVRKALRQKALLTTSKYPPRMEKELNNNGPKVKKPFEVLTAMSRENGTSDTVSKDEYGPTTN